MIRIVESDYLLIERRFAGFLKMFKGPRLAVLLCIALHADVEGRAEVGLAQIASETGYGTAAVSSAVKDLSCIRIDGKAVLNLSRPAARGRGKINSNALFKAVTDAPAGARSND